MAREVSITAPLTGRCLVYQKLRVVAFRYLQYVAQDIEREDYLKRRRSLMSDKKSVEEQIARLEHAPAAWIEPTRDWIKDASILEETAKTDDLPSKKLSLQKIFGSNLTLKKRGAFGIAQNHWLSLANAKEKISKNDLTLIMVRDGGIEPPLTGWKPAVLPLN